MTNKAAARRQLWGFIQEPIQTQPLLIMIFNEVAIFYAPYTATLYNDIDALAGIANYGTTTTDHYPVMTRYLFTGTLPPQRGLCAPCEAIGRPSARVTWAAPFRPRSECSASP